MSRGRSWFRAGLVLELRFNVMTQYFQQILKRPKGQKYFYGHFHSCSKDISNFRTRLKVLISSILKALNLECNIGRLSQWSLILSCSYFTSIYLKCPTLLLHYDWSLICEWWWDIIMSPKTSIAPNLDM